VSEKTEAEFRQQFPPGIYVIHHGEKRFLAEVEHVLGGIVLARNRVGFCCPIRDMENIRMVPATLRDVIPTEGIL
jgi:hypothetical protein